jgi:hypothetical protein
MISYEIMHKINPLTRRICSYGCAVLLGLGVAWQIKHHHWSSGKTHQKANAVRTTNLEPSRNYKPTLDIKSIVQHGHIVEIIGSAEAGSTVMVNGEKAAVIFDGSSFRHFVGPLPDGLSNISVTIQTDDGGVNTTRVAVMLP